MDFITFKKFISIPVLIAFYYFGAVIFPFLIWAVSTYLIKRYHWIETAQKKGKEKLWELLSKSQKVKFALALFIAFLFLELFWRMLFEFLIAYMQMRDALLAQ